MRASLFWVGSDRLRTYSLVATVGLMAAGLLLYATRRWGLGVSYDSVVYVQASHSLSRIGLPQPRDLGGRPLYWWAPVYPLALRAVGGGYESARWLNAGLLLVGTGAVGVTARAFLDGRAALIASVLYAFSPAVMNSHLSLLAEPLFLVLEVVVLAGVAGGRPALAGTAAGLASLTRYAGIPLLLVGGLILRGRDRLRFLVVSVVFYGSWLVRNRVEAGQWTGRELVWHPPDGAAARGAVTTLWHLLVTSGDLSSLHSASRLAGLASQAASAAALAFALVGSRHRQPPLLVRTALLFVAAYLLFLVITNSLFDALTPYDARLLVPVVPPLALTLGWLLSRTPVAAVVVSGAMLIATAQMVRVFSNYGMDYSGSVWNRARIGRTALPDGPLYSTWPAAIAYFTGASPQRVPNPVDEHTTKPNRRFRRELAAVEAAVRQGRASVVLLDERLLQIPGNSSPAATFPGLRDTCRTANPYIYVCTTRQS